IENMNPAFAAQAEQSAGFISRENIKRDRIKSVVVWRYPVGPDGTHGKPVQISSAEYDQQGNALHQTFLGQQAGTGHDVINRVDVRGRVVETFNQRPGPIGNVRMTYDYDAQGRMREIRSYKADGTVLLSIAYDLDKAGHPLGMTMLTGDGRPLYKAACG